MAHGGAGSFDASEHDGPERAAAAARNARGPPREAALAAVVAATRALEDDPRFNAGTGSNFRLDGKTIEMDAAVMTSDGRFGAVGAIRDVRNPVLVARDLLDLPHDLLVGEGATRFARAHGHLPHDPATPRAREKHARVREMLRSGKVEAGWSDWDANTLAPNWNFETDLRRLLGPSDTVGAVARVGDAFAAALSTGGTAAALLGRVGDVPLPGCGLRAGPAGAVCVTGDGEHLARARLADRAYAWLGERVEPEGVVRRACALFPPTVAVGLLVVSPTGHAGGSNLAMAWAAAEGSE